MKKYFICALSIITILIIGMGTVNAMSTHSSTISFSAGKKGYSSTVNKTEYATSYSTKLTSVSFIGFPSGMFPNSSVNVYFTPFLSDRTTPIAYRNYHNSTNLANGTIKHDDYDPSYVGAVNGVVLRSYCNNSNYGATVGVKWNLGYVNSLP